MHPSKATSLLPLKVRALALCQSEWRSANANSLWRRANARNVSFQSLYGGQFTLSTQLVNPKFCVSCPHQRNTTVSLGTNPLASSPRSCHDFEQVLPGTSNNQLPLRERTTESSFPGGACFEEVPIRRREVHCLQAVWSHLSCPGSNLFKGGAFFCYWTYILSISGWSEKLRFLKDSTCQGWWPQATNFCLQTTRKTIFCIKL